MAEKFYLGISLGFNSSACIASDKRGLIAAISEERLNGEKNTKRLPLDAAARCCEIAGASIIEKVCISHYEELNNAYLVKYGDILLTEKYAVDNLLKAVLSQAKVRVNNWARVPHHLAHACSPFAFYGYPAEADLPAYIITADGFGDGESGTIMRFDDEKIDYLGHMYMEGSLGLVYQFTTGALGFTEHKHEGKITGLASYGEPKYLDNYESLFQSCPYGNKLKLRDDIELNDEERRVAWETPIIDFDDYLRMKKAVYGMVRDLVSGGAKREDIAASVQAFTEKHIMKWITAAVDDTPTNAKCYLAGGIFSNVTLNRRIKDSGLFKEVMVCPAMGDEGTAVGACVHEMLCDETWPLAVSTTPYLGTDDMASCTSDWVEDTLNDLDLLDKYDVDTAHGDNLIDIITDALAVKKIVCLCHDKMEFGPRALCHRSILYDCTEKATNDWLNAQLGRTEFMPFAPVVRYENAFDLFYGLDAGLESSCYMTMSFDCTDEFKRDYPAACHVDNTARPQVVYYEDDEFAWKLLYAYEEKTGKKALINTSYNLHNWPIVESKETALDSFIVSHTDMLVMGNVIVTKKEEK